MVAESERVSFATTVQMTALSVVVEDMQVAMISHGPARSLLGQQLSPPVPERVPWAPAWDADTTNLGPRSASAEAGPSTYGLVSTTPAESGVNSIDEILRELGFDASTFPTSGMDSNQTGLSLDMEQMQAALGRFSRIINQSQPNRFPSCST